MAVNTGAERGLHLMFVDDHEQYVEVCRAFNASNVSGTEIHAEGIYPDERQLLGFSMSLRKFGSEYPDQDELVAFAEEADKFAAGKERMLGIYLEGESAEISRALGQAAIPEDAKVTFPPMPEVA